MSEIENNTILSIIYAVDTGYPISDLPSSFIEKIKKEVDKK